MFYHLTHDLAWRMFYACLKWMYSSNVRWNVLYISIKSILCIVLYSICWLEINFCMFILYIAYVLILLILGGYFVLFCFCVRILWDFLCRQSCHCKWGSFTFFFPIYDFYFFSCCITLARIFSPFVEEIKAEILA